MQNLSIKAKITLWYTLFMTLLIAVILAVLFSISNVQVLTNDQEHLKRIVRKAFDEIEYEDGMLTFDDDLSYMGEGVYLSVYDGNGYLLYGRVPSLLEGASSLVMDQVQQAKGTDGYWYVYDFCQAVEGYGNLWVRGIVSRSQSDSVLRIIMGAALILLPFCVLMIGLGGYFITRKILRPLSSMTQTARAISEGNDLSRRIHLGDGKDEIHQLAHTFDQMMERLQAAFENEKQFTSDVSHELRTPVAVILSQCEYSSQENLPAEELRDSLGVITAQARKMSVLINQLLLLARADNGKQTLHYELVNLSELIEMVVLEQQDSAEAKGILLETQLEPEVLLRADETMMMRLFINLISNSISYGREGGHTLIALSQSPQEIVCSVRDDGIGIPEDKLDKIWQRFYQVDPSRTGNAQGSSGLGLSMVKWIVTAHGGTISVTSHLGEGSCFTFRFPRSGSSPPEPSHAIRDEMPLQGKEL